MRSGWSCNCCGRDSTGNSPRGWIECKDCKRDTCGCCQIDNICYDCICPDGIFVYTINIELSTIKKQEPWQKCVYRHVDLHMALLKIYWKELIDLYDISQTSYQDIGGDNVGDSKFKISLFNNTFPTRIAKCKNQIKRIKKILFIVFLF